MALFPEEIVIGDDVYEPVSDESRIAVTYLLKVKDRLGLTDDVELEGSESSSARRNQFIHAYAFEIYKIWAALYPHEHQEFIAATKFDLKYERPIKEAIEAGGYTPTSFPARLDQLWSILLPKIKTQDKRFWKPLFSKIPELRKSNYA